MRTRSMALSALLTVMFASLGQAPAAFGQERLESLILRVFPMTHQPARQALPLVDPLLSPAGSVSLQQEDNALVVKDRASVLQKLEPLLAEFDHPKQRILVELHLLRATRASETDAGSNGDRASGLPPELVAELSAILRLNRYEALGSAKLDVLEGQTVSAKVGSAYRVRFEVGTVLRKRYVSLADFRVMRGLRAPQEQLFHGSVNLKLSRPAFVTVSRDAASASGLVMAFVWRPQNTSLSPTLSTGN